MKYEIGDRVRIINFPNPKRIGLKCRIIGRLPGGGGWFVKAMRGTEILWECYVYNHEIVKIPEKYEQLMLFDI